MKVLPSVSMHHNYHVGYSVTPWEFGAYGLNSRIQLEKSVLIKKPSTYYIQQR